MNIKKFFFSDKKETQIYAKTSRRGSSAAVDAAIVLLLRIFVAQVLGLTFVNPALIKFLEEFKEKFGTETVKNVPEHIDFIMHHNILIVILLFYSAVILVGALYYAFFNSSAWRATIGKRIFGIVIEKENGAAIGFWLALCHYFLSILPFAFITYLLIYKMSYNISFFSAIVSSPLNATLGVIFLLWTQIHSFTKKRTTAYDIICKTVLVNKKTAAKFPWSKEKVSNFL